MRNITYLRQQRGISQRELAEKLNLSLPAVQNAEREVNGVDSKWSTIEKIADFFDVSTDYLMGRSTSNSRQENIVSDEFTKEELVLIYDSLRKLRKLHGVK